MSFIEILTVAAFGIGLVGLGIAIWQAIAARRFAARVMIAHRVTVLAIEKAGLVDVVWEKGDPISVIWDIGGTSAGTSRDSASA
jgi:hypothetical protein